MNKKPKYRNKKVFVGETKFDSKLELFMFNKLKAYGIKFDFQYKYLLFPKFRFKDEGVRETSMIIDFRIKIGDKVIYVDTKGFPDKVAPLKYKILKFKEKDNENVDVIWLKNESQVLEFINKIKSRNEQFKQSNIDW